MTKKRMLIAGAAVAVLVAGGIGGVAVANGGGDDGEGEPITGSAYDRATTAALDATGEGRVTATEVNDEESKYEVEVTLDDGTEVDVRLDDQFNVVAQEREDGDESDDEGAQDD